MCLRGELIDDISQQDAHIYRRHFQISRARFQTCQVEQIKRHVLLPREWLPGGDELTPTMKLRRKPIAAKYAAEIAALYAT